VGFGISTRDDVVWFNQHSDGAVVGSAIIKNMNGSSNPVGITKSLIQNLKGIIS
jgi:tryptophan synthase alpha subunit